FDAGPFQLLGAPLVICPLRVAAVDDRAPPLEQPGELADRFLRSRARREHQPHHPRRLQLLDQIPQRTRGHGPVLDRLLDGSLAAAVTDHLVVGVAADAMNHVPAHLAQPDETDLRHLGSLILSVRARKAPVGSPPASVIRSAGRPSSRRVFSSPMAWACLRVVKVYGAPGMSTSAGPSWISCRKRPIFGPPLWNCPVECRKRGP